MKRANYAAGLVLAFVATTATACGGGGGSSAPDDASVDDFCATYNGLVEKMIASGSTESADLIKTLKEYAEQLSKTGTPKDMPDDAREGFELSIDAIKGLPDDATEADLAKLDSDFTEDQQKKGEAFATYVQKTCPTPDLGLPSELPSGLPTDLPSDLPSGLPTDLPTDPSELQSMLDELTSSP